MPEATVNEDRHLLGGEDEIRFTSDRANRSDMKAEPESLAVKCRAEGQLGSRVTPLLPLHSRACLFGRGRRNSIA
jgi:hypothetical protein